MCGLNLMNIVHFTAWLCELSLPGMSSLNGTPKLRGVQLLFNYWHKDISGRL